VNLSEYRTISTPDNLKRIIVVIDEYAEVTDATAATKEEKTKIDAIQRILNRILRLGRAVGIHVIISTQRPDATILSGSIKSNIDVRICGKADSTLSTIVLGDGRAHESIPKDSQGRFLLNDGAEDIVFQAFLYEE